MLIHSDTKVYPEKWLRLHYGRFTFLYYKNIIYKYIKKKKAPVDLKYFYLSSKIACGGAQFFMRFGRRYFPPFFRRSDFYFRFRRGLKKYSKFKKLEFM
ncbi:hypothetical protein LEP1GSC047_2002 [Leptospira inadai serovar Lyme str. 10]|uniref:Uncharacterized protein n=2 Tax=Leptospira inadai serovar Lyme TaxID=293084 RepID=V6HN83_9LEPT|nr:hypothetical protein LEP1GSC047_2002 [Leptospira inadai serovar Lyme str. 10]PNV74401.1 hypothetical protein BES34_013625 [Leptospira inadai serovar Lyme]